MGLMPVENCSRSPTPSRITSYAFENFHSFAHLSKNLYHASGFRCQLSRTSANETSQTRRQVKWKDMTATELAFVIS